MLISNNVTRIQNIDKRIKILKYLKNNLMSNTYLLINLYEPYTVVKAGNDMDKKIKVGVDFSFFFDSIP